MNRSYFIIFLLSLLLPGKLYAQANQTVSNGDTTTAVKFPVISCTYNWANSNPSIGLPANGAGNISSFTAINNSGNPITATITATASPGTSGFAYIANYYSNTVSVINTSSTLVVGIISGFRSPFAVAASPDGSKVYVTNDGPDASNTFNVSVIDVATNTVTGTIPVEVHPEGIAISPDGTRVYVANVGSNTVSVIDAASNKLINTISLGSSPFGIVVSPGGNFLYVSNIGSNNIFVIDTVTNQVTATITVDQMPQVMAITPNGSKLFVANFKGNSVSVINTASNTVTSTINAGFNPQVVALSNDGKRLYIRYFRSPDVIIVNTATYAVIDTLHTTASNSAVAGIAQSPDGSKVYLINSDGGVSVFDSFTDKFITSVAVGIGPVSTGNFMSRGVGCPGSTVNFTITVNPSPVISSQGSVGKLNAIYGTPSVERSFMISGTGVSAGILVTPPPGFEVSLNDVVFSGTVTVSGSGVIVPTAIYVRLAANSPAGTYSGKIVLGSGKNAQNGPSLNGDVNPATLIITANNKTRFPNTQNPAFTVSYAGFVNNDGPAQLAVLPVANTIANINSAAGTYLITVSGAVASNYNFTYLPGRLTITALLPILVIPNAFTPNNDGINDTWDIQYVSSYPGATYSVFNRYGQKVFFSTGYAVPWNGRYKGVNVPDGTYYYIINTNDSSKTISGKVSVLR